MTKLSRTSLDLKDFGRYINNVWSVFTLLDSKEDVRAFFHSLFTHTEYKMFAKRLEIARRLIEGETYESIARDLKVTEHTIASISNILARDGYGFKIAHQKLQGLDQAHQKKREQRQDYLERKRWPKFREQILVEGLVKAGTAKVSSLLRKRTRQSTARKQLSV
ncbi:MAG: hypothetical protein A3J07_00295 [Candidatus Doudnabacteria bacterium RIFCSPLOWO2_02_FULL_49_13]|uniref:TrpR like protein, YerC/YecD n=1 Tax=Candidatus Doudnabacteria bacterium RIFCSPHIGHO2_12_FULL_48_16 TaxID=1817838 RepID=A0A1F5PIM2_9BACT|nr:MAG: hypothetical protein A3B77_00185 [Candidatus Doudnabacteria bacterium RIFCSPHIGHO2_02_FULL_49_24]OGE89547.1 MAG: hypothetical protein A2760_03445 [Candidatus Doudnabacteria bacterium RIFCSPHIGHO2_01_FULL_50_67]OGE89798.1 MAG: hypothetical protein A3E29_00215 [Candidatus Doudnabacteria bacterium RIFCSPHIGHO2_12_FULL_48_16]OGE97702.1 MAG: hypothetical protein A2990_00695 [Candidatus Doudnabacteria bacterium RIFCSPLOWO2_01_FULL_49_40]OGF02801.1 MAG: hypothetical protein A3J07_00295 [Candid